MSEFDQATLERVHATSHDQRARVMLSRVAGCFFCLRIFPATEIDDWLHPGEDGLGRKAVCPYCLVDSIIADGSGHELTTDLLKAMKAHYFWPDDPSDSGREAAGFGHDGGA
ncbi:hypothetical protein [Spectribacter hydrogenoxidans]|uniref:Cytoplasmic protein n=1 Tax=Spectribacter hydrogenoxidans TaxID=3075608 RepID=A0ABU3C430_9GAMM|nr:hypothetical protein [Salinisphaera sp. W335]MDT0636297.1 hypothetical protein [Salinisphaera sp. W335]